ncbi:MAG: hypothetical protein R2822_09390 [Spirosomataceae bacterium]
MKAGILTIVLWVGFWSNTLYAQFGPPTGEPDVLNKRWHAQWITVPNASNDGYGVYLFRKTIDISSKPTNYLIHVSADNRYKLFINEKIVSHGPARGDIEHWNYESVDIASYLKVGKNTIAAQVWNEGEFKPEAQITFRTAFILQGSTSAESAVNTNNSWLCEKDNSFAPLRFNVRAYYVSGAGEIRNFATEIKNWQRDDFNDSQWQKARPLGYGVPKNVLGAFGTMSGWMLVPSIIPQMELKDERLAKVVINEGNIAIPSGFPVEKKGLNIPANASIKLILDQSYLTNAYPNLSFSGGKNASISVLVKLCLAVANPKGNRNEVNGKNFIGRTDSLVADGSNEQRFTTLTYRTYRYIQIKIVTKDQPLVLNDIYGTFTGYPFELKATTTSQNPEIKDILNIGWRTARL